MQIGEKYDFHGENSQGLLAFFVPKDAMLRNFVEKTKTSVKCTKVFSLESFPLYSKWLHFGMSITNCRMDIPLCTARTVLCIRPCRITQFILNWRFWTFKNFNQKLLFSKYKYLYIRRSTQCVLIILLLVVANVVDHTSSILTQMN